LEGQSKPHILIFFYGGGLTRGMRSQPPLVLVHNNLGAFFASKGILTVIPDYRLVPSAVFSDSSQDVHDAITWVAGHVAEGDSTRVFILGHSAGGVHVSGLFLMPSMLSAMVASVVRGIALLGVPYKIMNCRTTAFCAAAEKYYGSAKNIGLNEPLELLRRADPAHIARLPPMLNLIAKSEPRVVSSAMKIFSREITMKGSPIEEYTLNGHDHISPILALGTGSGEEWGNHLADWIFAH
jgi:acetyl esterase/lipase